MVERFAKTIMLKKLQLICIAAGPVEGRTRWLHLRAARRSVSFNLPTRAIRARSPKPSLLGGQRGGWARALRSQPHAAI
jgi:hypothetical protein